jgi:hypothetical protein
MTRFCLLPGLRRTLLRPATVQIGADPERSLLLELPDNRFVELLNRLDSWLDEAGYALTARRLGVPRDQAAYLLTQLRGAGVLLDTAALVEDGAAISRRPALSSEAAALALRRTVAPGPLLARRRRQRIFINGMGTLAQQVTGLLREAEIGRVWCADDSRRGKATVAVLFDPVQPPSLISRAHARRGLAYLTVSSLDGAVHIGPMVRPGLTPCVRCVELHYRDHLPQWRNGGGAGTPMLETATRSVAAATIVSLVLQHVDGETCLAEAASIQVRPSLRIKRRRWRPHPDCGCVDVAGQSAKPISKVSSRSCLE